MSEKYHTCPQCGQPGFTASGLKAHQGNKTCTRRAGQMQPGAALTVISSDDKLMGEQLTEQYKRAVGGMQQVIICGAMMMKLRETYPELTQKGPAAKSKSTRGLTPQADAPMTLEKWLATYAPEVKKSTAYRFLHVSESIARKYAEIVGSKTAKLISMPELVTTPADQLPKGCEAKQLEFFEFINGTSQRSWLDMFSPASPQKRGSANRDTDKPKPKTAAELAEDAESEINGVLTLLDGWILAGHHTRISKDLRATTDATLTSALTKLRGVKQS